MADIREIVFDTETTGFEPSEGHRLIEIGCVELLNHLPTGNHFHVYLNPQRDVPSDAVRIHGLTTEFLQDKPLFTEKVGDFLDFIGDATLVIHNAEFDMKFINAELKMAGFPKPLSMTREIVLDTETTGFDPAEGHRLVEIGCVELENHLPTGRVFHTYLNPMRDVPADATRVHGLTTEFLKNHPLFTEKVSEFLDFIEGAQLVIHNAEFDMKFLNAELKSCGFKPLPMTRAIDTLLIARQKFPGQPANLDALCRRFKIDNTERKLHGALLDAQLLAEVYLELLGGRQHGLGLAAEAAATSAQLNASIKRQDRPQRSFPPTEAEIAAHEKFIEKVKDNLWSAAKKAEG